MAQSKLIPTQVSVKENTGNGKVTITLFAPEIISESMLSALESMTLKEVQILAKKNKWAIHRES